MFQQQNTTPLAAPEELDKSTSPSSDLNTTLQKEEVVDLKQYIDLEANNAAEARLSDLMKALDTNGDGHVSVSEFKEKATEEHLNKLQTEGVITGEERIKISQDHRHHRVINSMSDSQSDMRTDTLEEQDLNNANDPALHQPASINDILAAMRTTEVKEEMIASTLETERVEDTLREQEKSLNQEPLEHSKAVEVSPEVDREQSEHLEIETVIPAVIEHQHTETLIPEVTKEKEIQNTASLNETLERLEKLSNEMNSDLLNAQPLPTESFATLEGTIVTTGIAEKEVKERVVEPTEATDRESNDATVDEIAVAAESVIEEPLDTEEIIRRTLDQNNVLSEEPSSPHSIPAQRIDHETASTQENRQFKGRRGDLVFSIS
ncbi:EF-hand domain-containing protein [bacterium]|jgi:hypothetical protein|nr:EF-hand domain-containing protein [bacterium]